MNKLFLLILILGLIIFYCINQNIEKFTWAWGYYPVHNPNKYKKTKGLPTGSWRRSCIIQDFRDPLLWASCENDRGKYIEASINISKCFNRKIKNVNGVLECN